MADNTNGRKPKYPVAQDARELLSIDDLQTVVLDIDAWQKSIIMRPLTQQETENIMQAATVPDAETGRVKTDLVRANRMALAACLVQPPMTIEDVDALCTQHAGAVVSELIQNHLELNHWDRLFGGGQGTGKVGEGNADAAFPMESNQKTSV